jgi:hypothetical protein
MSINPGYIGYADIGGTLVRCNDFSVNVKQEPLFYDHIIGLRDTIPTNIYDIKGPLTDPVASGTLYNPQKILWRPGVKISQGGFTFPWTDDTISSGTGGSPMLWEEARGAGEFDMDFYHTSDIARKFTGCKINTYSFKISAGDIVTSSMDIMAIHEESLDASGLEQISTSNKIVTWDAVSIASDIIGSNTIVSLEFSINNALIPIYTAGSNANPYNSLEAKEIRAGMQQLTGNLTFYDANSLNFLESIADANTITVSIGDFSFNLTVIFNPMTQPAAVGPVIRTLPFTGVDYNLV